MAPQVAGDTEASDAADASAYLLYPHHQRITEYQRPGQAGTELSTHLRIGAIPPGSSSDAPVIMPGPST